VAEADPVITPNLDSVRRPVGKELCEIPKQSPINRGSTSIEYSDDSAQGAASQLNQWHIGMAGSKGIRRTRDFKTTARALAQA
jgi:hypothetical protein